MKRFLKSEIKFVPTEDLNIRYCRILERAEILDAKDIPVADAREILWIEDILRERTIKAVGHDFYPPEGVAKPTMADLRARLSPFKKSTPAPSSKLKPMPAAKPAPKPAQPAAQAEGKLRFKVDIVNSMGSTVSTLNLHVNGKGEAEAEALKTITQLGLKKATYKIC